jgi:chromate transporter
VSHPETDMVSFTGSTRAGPAAIGAIAGAAIPLALALTETWQLAVLAAAAFALFVLCRAIVPTLIAAGAAGALASALGAPLPS